MENQKKYNYVWNIAKENNIDFYDFNYIDLNLEPHNDYYDVGYLSKSGSEKFSNYFSEIVKKDLK